ncbi:hypothetical protein AMTRI_Chr02g258730 [Amborella trichopoda]
MISLACNCCLHGSASHAQTLSPLALVLVQVSALSSVQLSFLHLQNSLLFFLRRLAY